MRWILCSTMNRTHCQPISGALLLKYIRANEVLSWTFKYSGRGDTDTLIGGKKNRAEKGLRLRSVGCSTAKFVKKRQVRGASVTFSTVRKDYLLYNDMGKGGPGVVDVYARHKRLLR